MTLGVRRADPPDVGYGGGAEVEGEDRSRTKPGDSAQENARANPDGCAGVFGRLFVPESALVVTGWQCSRPSGALVQELMKETALLVQPPQLLGKPLHLPLQVSQPFGHRSSGCSRPRAPGEKPEPGPPGNPGRWPGWESEEPERELLARTCRQLMQNRCQDPLRIHPRRAEMSSGPYRVR